MRKQDSDGILAGVSQEVDALVSEISIFKQLIRERVHHYDLVRELLSNAGAKEVGSKNIEVSYTKDKEGHVFTVSDDGCGMDYTGDNRIPGRLDKFLGLGLSGIIGIKHDEFSWKGLGSKLAYQSRRVEIETCAGGNNSFYDVRINEPWETISNNNLPKPRISRHPSQEIGTKIKVVGHPPHRDDKPFTFTDIKTFMLHRTFVGFTGNRETFPEIELSVLGNSEILRFGFPEFRSIDFESFAQEGFLLDDNMQTLYINIRPRKGKSKQVTVKGFITWDASRHGLSKSNLNTGLILSVKGIPYFQLDMEEYGVSSIRTARPGENKCCLVVECDWIQDEMNISRSGLVDSQKTVELKRIVAEIFERIESADEYLKFRRIPERKKLNEQSGYLAEEKRKIGDSDQEWVVFSPEGEDPVVLVREPKNEQDVNILIWKLEALGALPFTKFRTLAYIGASKGPDVLVSFQEEEGSEPHPATVFEIENNFYNYKAHGHSPTQYPRVICWDAPTSGRKLRLSKTNKPYKFTQNTENYQLHVFVVKHMDNIRLMTRRELDRIGVKI